MKVRYLWPKLYDEELGSRHASGYWGALVWVGLLWLVQLFLIACTIVGLAGFYLAVFT